MSSPLGRRHNSSAGPSSGCRISRTRWRGEAWEYTEEVEENHISTDGHGVRPGWMTDDEAAQFERKTE